MMTPKFKAINRPSVSPTKPRPGNSGQKFTSAAVNSPKPAKMGNAQIWKKTPPSGPRYEDLYLDHYRPAEHQYNDFSSNSGERRGRVDHKKATPSTSRREQPFRQHKDIPSIEQHDGLPFTPAFGGPDVHSDYNPDDNDTGCLSDGSSEKSRGMSSKRDGSSVTSPTSSQKSQISTPSRSSTPTSVARSSSAVPKEEDGGVGNSRGMGWCYPSIEYKSLQQERFEEDGLMEIDEQEFHGFEGGSSQQTMDVHKQSTPVSPLSSSQQQSRERSSGSPIADPAVALSRKRSTDHDLTASPCKKSRESIDSMYDVSPKGMTSELDRTAQSESSLRQAKNQTASFPRSPCRSKQNSSKVLPRENSCVDSKVCPLVNGTVPEKPGGADSKARERPLELSSANATPIARNIKHKAPLCPASALGDSHIKGHSSVEDTNSARLALRKREVDDPLRKSKHDLAQHPLKQPNCHDVEGFDDMSLATIRHIAGCSNYSQELNMFCRSIIKHGLKPEKEKGVDFASVLGKEHNSYLEDCTAFAEKLLASNVDPSGSSNMRPDKSTHAAFAPCQKTSVLEHEASGRHQSEIAPVNFYGSCSLTNEPPALDCPASLRDNCQNGLKWTLETCKEWPLNGVSSNLEKAYASSLNVEAIDDGGKTTRIREERQQKGIQSYNTPPSSSPSMHNSREACTRPATGIPQGITPPNSSPISMKKSKRKRLSEGTGETGVDHSPESSPKRAKRREKGINQGAEKRKNDRDLLKSIKKAMYGRTPFNSPERQAEKDKRSGSNKDKRKSGKVPCPSQAEKGEKQAPSRAHTKAVTPSRPRPPKTQRSRSSASSSERAKRINSGKPGFENGSDAAKRSSIRGTNEIMPSPTPMRSGSKACESGNAQNVEKTPMRSPGSSNGSSVLPSPSSFLYQQPIRTAPENPPDEPDNDVYNIDNEVDSPPRHEMRAPSTALVRRAPISTQGMRHRHQSVPAYLAGQAGDSPIQRRVDASIFRDVMKGAAKEAMQEVLHDTGIIATNRSLAGPAPQSNATAPSTNHPAATVQRKSKYTSAAEQRQTKPELTYFVPWVERKSDEELIEIGKIVNGYERHCLAHYAYSWWGRLNRKDYAYLEEKGDWSQATIRRIGRS